LVRQSRKLDDNALVQKSIVSFFSGAGAQIAPPRAAALAKPQRGKAGVQLHLDAGQVREFFICCQV
jgi:hypothetical protein